MPCVLDPTLEPRLRRPHPDQDERVRRVLAARVATDQASKVAEVARLRMRRLSEWAGRGFCLCRWSSCFLDQLDRAVVAFGEANDIHRKTLNRELELFDLTTDDDSVDGWAR